MNVARLLLACLSIVVMAPSLSAPAVERHIMAWGLATSEGLQAGVNELRLGCGSSPNDCISVLMRSALSGIDYAALAIPSSSRADQLLGNSIEYSRIARQLPALREIGIDDFRSFVWRLKVKQPAKYLQELISNIKSNNSGLNFGITVYDHDIDKLVHSDKTPPQVRNLVDRVALYVPKRRAITNYEKVLAKAHYAFPNAKIYAGIYHYDRKDYTSCSSNSKQHCTLREDWTLYIEALHLQIGLLKSGKVDGVELYPGQFGKQRWWRGWSKPRVCAPKRRAECIEITKRMTDTLVRALKEDKSTRPCDR